MGRRRRPIFATGMGTTGGGGGGGGGGFFLNSLNLTPLSPHTQRLLSSPLSVQWTDGWGCHYEDQQFSSVLLWRRCKRHLQKRRQRCHCTEEKREEKSFCWRWMLEERNSFFLLSQRRGREREMNHHLPPPSLGGQIQSFLPFTLSRPRASLFSFLPNQYWYHC